MSLAGSQKRLNLPSTDFLINLLIRPYLCNNRACMWCHPSRPSTPRNPSYSYSILGQAISSCKASNLWGVTTSVDYFRDQELWRTHSFLSRSCNLSFGPCQRISWGSDGGTESQQCCCSFEWKKAFHQICSDKWCLIGPQSRSLSCIFRFYR